MDIESGLRRRAATVRADAEALQRCAAAVAALHDVAWESAAAELFRRQVTERVGSLRELAQRVAGLAVLLEELAAAVRHAGEE